MNDKKALALIRLAFGLIWTVDAWFKWQPAFFANFTSYLSGNLGSQPPLVRGWINLWIGVVGVNPHFFAFAVAVAETAIALALISGILPRLTTAGGVAMSLVIWSTAEGFGGPYAAGSTDIGAAVIYALVFLALYFGRAWEEFSLQKRPR